MPNTPDTQAPAVEDHGTEASDGQDTQESPQPETPVTPVAEAVAAEAEPKVEDTQQPSKPSGFQAQIDKLKATGTAEQTNLIANLELYMEAMKVGMPVDPDKGANNQYLLWKIIYNVAESSAKPQFKSLWSIILLYFHEFRDGVFSDRYVYRFADAWSKPKAELDAFQRIVNLIKLTAAPSTRVNNLKQVDLNRTLAVGFQQVGRDRILAFYSR